MVRQLNIIKVTNNSMKSVCSIFKKIIKISKKFAKLDEPAIDSSRTLQYLKLKFDRDGSEIFIIGNGVFNSSKIKILLTPKSIKLTELLLNYLYYKTQSAANRL